MLGTTTNSSLKPNTGAACPVLARRVPSGAAGRELRDLDGDKESYAAHERQCGKKECISVPAHKSWISGGAAAKRCLKHP